MAETGWPLIPRELLPAPVPVARRKRPAEPGAASRERLPGTTRRERQLSIFGAESTDASPLDVVGLLAGPGRLERMGGTARVSVPVDTAWRVHVLAAELVSRGLVVNWKPLEGGGFEVRTAYSSRLNDLARTWPAAADQLFFNGARIRLWVAAAGAPHDDGYAFGLTGEGPIDLIDTALRRAGLDGAVFDDTVSDQGRCYLITGRQRLRRLAELVGERPASAPDPVWPGGARA
jgi:hypothetical protein